MKKKFTKSTYFHIYNALLLTNYILPRDTSNNSELCDCRRPRGNKTESQVPRDFSALT